MSQPADIGGLRPPGTESSAPAAATAPVATAGRELFVRHARRDGRSVAVLRAMDHGGWCVVEAEVFPAGPGAVATRPGPYTFANPHEATAFVTEAVEALMYLGCDIAAS